MIARKPFTSLASVIFAAIALVHLYRVVKPFPVTFGDHTVSQGVSWVAVLVAGGLAALLWLEGRR
ncbi:hypothetical protein [Novosphingobium sp. Gsoil 351]|uniref:hypothetical protein n=1 Tax=Novosphingobium sp. Gsoil 351 TaxID=2675225 RepID=UPI0012B4B561|nr:hypothetical protein [Novosphingobium sp. Gsoil 351]QGN55513.1 hypothetical protein GKE62_14085 [Novosphingobium sp. Gsoil 351]